MIHALLLDGQGGARRLAWHDLSEWRREQGLFWVHLDYSNATAQDWLRQQSGLAEMVAEALLTEETRPRVSNINNALLVTLRGVNLNPGADPEDMVSLRIWAEGGRIISTRRRRLLSIADLVHDLDMGTGPCDEGEVLVRITDYLIRRMSDVVDKAEEEIAGIEERVLSDLPVGLRSEVAALRRQVIALRRHLAPQRDALSRLMTENVPWLRDLHRLHLREVLERLTRYIEDLDEVRDRCLVAHEEIQSRVAEQLNRRMYVLSLVAAIFLPLGFLTGLMGINVGGIPGADNPWAFKIFLGLLGVLVLLQFWLFRRMRWF